MAIWVENIQSKDIQNQQKSVGLVVDISFLNDLKLVPGQTKEWFSNALNLWAEKQVDDLSEIKLLKEIINNPNAIDAYFEKELIEDCKSDIDGLKKIFVDYLWALSDFSNETQALAKAVSFKLTEKGYSEIQWNSIMTPEATKTYYATTGQGPLSWTQSSVSSSQDNYVNTPYSAGNSTINTVAATTSSNQDPYTTVSYWAWNNGFRPTVPTQLDEIVDQKEEVVLVPNSKVTYEYENIYARKTPEWAKDYADDMRRWQIRRMVGKWIKWKDDDYLDIQELSGDAKINKPDKQEKTMLREYFKRPLQRLTINNKWLFFHGISKDQRFDAIALWDLVVTTFNSGELWKNWGDLDNLSRNHSSVWKNYAETSLDKHSDKALFVTEMSKLSALYSVYRNNQLNGSYTDRLIKMMDQSVLRGAWGAEATNGDARWNTSSLVNIHNQNNNEVWDIDLWEWHEVITTTDKRRFEKKGLENLKSLFSELSWANFDKKILSGKVGREQVKHMLNISQLNPNKSLEIRFEWWREMYDFIRANKLPDAYAPNNTEKDLSVVLAEWYAYEASPVDMYNIKAIADFASPTVSDPIRFVNFLSDYNNNGRVWPEDHFVNGWAQLMTNYRDAVEQRIAESNEEKSQAELQVAHNILQYMIVTSANRGDAYVSETLKWYQNNQKSLVDIAREHPAFIVYMQDILKTLPPKTDLQSIMVNADTYTESRKQKEIVNKLTPLEQQQLKETIDQESLRLYNDIQWQLKELSPEERQYFDYITRESLAQHISETVSTSLQTNEYGAGLGVAIKLAKWIQANVSLAMWPDGIPVPGIWLWLNTATRKGWTIWANINFLVPGVSAHVGHSREGNVSKLAKTMQSKSFKTHAVTAHGGISILAISAGIGYQQDIDYMRGIETTYQNISKESQKFLPTLLKDPKISSAYKRIVFEVAKDNYLNKFDAIQTDKKTVIDGIAKKLTAQYPWQTTSDYLAAANNIFEAMINTQFMGGQDGYDNISSYFAEQWKADAINKLKNKVKVTGWGVWLHAFISPSGLMGVLPFTMRLSKYNRWSKHVDTDASLLYQKHAEYKGQNNRFLPITPEKRVNYMNGVLFSNAMSQFDEWNLVKLSADGAFIELPLALFKTDRLNIKISPVMEWKLAIEGENMIIPVDVPLRMSTFTQSQWVEYILNIWSTITSSQDIHLLKGRESLLNQPWWFKESREELSVNHTDMEVGINEQDLINKLSVYWLQVIGLNGNNIVYMDNNIQKEISLDWGQVVVSDGSTITFSRVGDRLNFAVLKANGSQVVNNTVENLVYQKVIAQDIIDYITHDGSKIVEKFETTHPTELKNFIAAAIDNNDAKALTYLSALKVPRLQEAISSADSDMKSEIVAYMLQAFALEDVWYKNQTVLKLLAHRWSAYTRIEWAWNISSFVSPDMLKSIYMTENLKDLKPGTHNPDYNDIIWYTAFYRGTRWNHRGYAMTLPWYTRVLWGKINTFPQWSSEEAMAKDWLLDKVKSDEFARRTILKSIKEKFKESPDVATYITEANIVNILRWEKVTLQNWCVVHLNAKPVFYLLGECANESCGLQVEDITCVWPNSEVMSVDGNLLRTYNQWIFAINTTRTAGSETIWRKNIVNLGVAAWGKMPTKTWPVWWNEWTVTTNPGSGWLDDPWGTTSGTWGWWNDWQPNPTWGW